MGLQAEIRQAFTAVMAAEADVKARVQFTLGSGEVRLADVVVGQFGAGHVELDDQFGPVREQRLTLAPLANLTLVEMLGAKVEILWSPTKTERLRATSGMELAAQSLWRLNCVAEEKAT